MINVHNVIWHGRCKKVGKMRFRMKKVWVDVVGRERYYLLAPLPWIKNLIKGNESCMEYKNSLSNIFELYCLKYLKCKQCIYFNTSYVSVVVTKMCFKSL